MRGPSLSVIAAGLKSCESCAYRSTIAAGLKSCVKPSNSSLQLREQLTATKSEMVDLYAQLSVQNILEGDDDPRSAGQVVVIRFGQPSQLRQLISDYISINTISALCWYKFFVRRHDVLASQHIPDDGASSFERMMHDYVTTTA